MRTASMSEHDRLAYGAGEAAQLIGFSRNGFSALLDKGLIPSFHVGRKRIVKHSDLIAFLDRESRSQSHGEKNAA